MKKVIIIMLLIFTACNNHEEANNTNNNQFDFEKIYTLGLQGKISEIFAILDTIPDSKLSNEQIKLKEKYYRRFKQQNENFDYTTNDSSITNICDIFHSYWQTVFIDNENIEKADIRIEDNIINLLKKNDFIGTDISRDSLVENLNNYLKEFVQTEGFYSNAMNKTGSFYDIFIWAKETEKSYKIDLPESIQDVKVIFMEDFVSNGWADYATFGRYYAAGWARKDALYCVKKAYDISSEKFRVSYLTHEAQHFADYKRFPILKQADLEYRAKLAELSKSEETIYKLLNRFIKRADNNKSYAHSFANYCVIRDLSKKIFNQEYIDNTGEWGKISSEEINRVSKELMKANTMELKKIGPEIVTEYIH